LEVGKLLDDAGAVGSKVPESKFLVDFVILFTS
jgi:hypothetical protein